MSTHFNGSESDFQDHRSLLRVLAAIEPLPTCSESSTPERGSGGGNYGDTGGGYAQSSQDTESSTCDGLFHKRLMRTIEGYQRPVEPAIAAFLNADSEPLSRGHHNGSSTSGSGSSSTSSSSRSAGVDSPRRWRWQWPGNMSAAVALLEDVYEGESVSLAKLVTTILLYFFLFECKDVHAMPLLFFFALNLVGCCCSCDAHVCVFIYIYAK